MTKFSWNFARFLTVFGNFCCFCNPVYSASLCLIPHFIAVLVRHKMCLVAQFENWLFRVIIVFGTSAFNIIRQKSNAVAFRVVFFFIDFSFPCWNFISRFVVYFQGVTVSYSFISRKFRRGLSNAHASIKLRQHNWSLRCYELGQWNAI